MGTRTATWPPPATTRNAARTASSVFPKPTSPQSMRSMGFSLARSASISRSAFAWSSVSSQGKASTIARTISPSPAQAGLWRRARLACTSISSAARSKSPFWTFSLRLRNALPPILSRVIEAPPPM